MGVLSGAMTARRYRVVGQLPPMWRDRWREQLDAMAFREAAGNVAGASASGGSQGKEELEGWVLSQNLLDTDFSDFNRWLFDGRYAVFSLRVDKKSLPANLLKATVEVECRKWCEENPQVVAKFLRVYFRVSKAMRAQADSPEMAKAYQEFLNAGKRPKT